MRAGARQDVTGRRYNATILRSSELKSVFSIYMHVCVHAPSQCIVQNERTVAKVGVMGGLGCGRERKRQSVPGTTDVRS